MKVALIFCLLISWSIKASALNNSKVQKPVPQVEETEVIPADSNCKIVINTERFTGIRETQTIHTKATSKKECQEKSAPHKYNFYPKEIKKKDVKVIYKGQAL